MLFVNYINRHNIAINYTVYKRSVCYKYSIIYLQCTINVVDSHSKVLLDTHVYIFSQIGCLGSHFLYTRYLQFLGNKNFSIKVLSMMICCRAARLRYIFFLFKMTGIEHFLSLTIWVLRRSGIGPIQFLKVYILISTFKDLSKMLKIHLITSELSNEHSFVNQD